MTTWICRQCGEDLEARLSMATEQIECPNCGSQSEPPAANKEPQPLVKKHIMKTGRGSLFDALLGNASSIEPMEVARDVDHLLVPDERVELVFKLVRDLIVFTDRRLILIDKQGVTGKKVEYLSVPFKNIVQFSVETAGTLDRDSEMKIYVSGNPYPVTKQFRKGGVDIFDVQRAIAMVVVGS